METSLLFYDLLWDEINRVHALIEENAFTVLCLHNEFSCLLLDEVDNVNIGKGIGNKKNLRCCLQKRMHKQHV